MNPLEVFNLDWKTHPAGAGCKQATIRFPNGYGASILHGGRYYTRDGTYELAVLKNGSICYDSGLTNDVFGYQTAEQIAVILDQIQEL